MTFVIAFSLLESCLSVAPESAMRASFLSTRCCYSWPGNVRELQNVIERAVVVSRGPQITESDLSGELRGSVASPGSAVEKVQAGSRMQNMAEAMNEYKRALIRKALDASGGNQTQAAELLGLRQGNLSRMIKTLGIQ